MERDVMSETDKGFPARIFVWDDCGWIDAENTVLRKGEAEYVRADCGSFYQEKVIDALMAERDNLRAERDRLRGALEWYGEQARLAKLAHHEGDTGRHALAMDGGGRARAALQGESPDND
jgi:hypothetical protein